MCWTTCRHLCTSVVAMSQIGGIVSKYMLQESGRSISRWIGKTGKRVCCGEVVTEVHMTLQRQLYNVVHVVTTPWAFCSTWPLVKSLTPIACGHLPWNRSLCAKEWCHVDYDLARSNLAMMIRYYGCLISSHWMGSKYCEQIICMLNNALAQRKLHRSSAYVPVQERPCNVIVVYTRIRAHAAEC